MRRLTAGVLVLLLVGGGAAAGAVIGPMVVTPSVNIKVVRENNVTCALPYIHDKRRFVRFVGVDCWPQESPVLR